MWHALFLITSLTAMAPNEVSPVQSQNGEFIFSHYPARAKAAGEQGSVRFQAEVDAKGTVVSCKVTAGSGHEQLDRETCEMIAGYARFKPTLDNSGKSRAAVHDGVVNWRLPGRAPAPAKVALGGRLPDDIVCKRTSRTGSLVAQSRQCMTRQEWIKYAEEHQRDGEELRDKIGWQPCSMREGDGLPSC